MKNFFKKLLTRKKKIRVIGTLRIPKRYTKLLAGLGSALDIFIGGETNTGGISYSSSEDVARNTYAKNISRDHSIELLGASYIESSRKYSTVYEIVISGEFIDGPVLAAYKPTGTSIHYPGIVIIEIV